MESKRTNFKIFYYIWGILLVALLGYSLFMDADTSVLVVTLVVLFGGAAIFRSWKNSVVEIEIEDGVAHMYMLDGKKKAIYIKAIVQIRETNTGTFIRFADGEEVRTRKGKEKIVVRHGDSVVNCFRKEDFPFAEIVKVN